MTSPVIAKMSSKDWRLAHLYKITTKDKEEIKYRENYVQRLVRLNRSPRKKILKARQLGISTGCLISLLDDTIFYRNTTSVILAHKREALEKIFNIVKFAYNKIPYQYKPKIDRGGGSKYELSFEGINSKIYAATDVRGGTIHRLHISEAAFIEESRINATLDAVPIDGHVTYETTANGYNHFRKLWFSENMYDKLFFPWFFDQDYKIATGPLTRTPEEDAMAARALLEYNMVISDEQIAFRRFKIADKNGNVDMFLQEFPENDQTCFLTSGSNPFDMLILEQRLKECTQPIRYLLGIEIFEERNIEHDYIIGADVAEGVRSDYSVITVVCVQTLRQVAFYRSNTIDPGDFGEVIYKVAQMYSYPGHIAKIICERNNHGHATILRLTQLGANLWRDRDDKPGHHTTTVSRPILIDLFIDAIKNGTVLIRARKIIEECQTLVDNNGKIEAADGEHDDSVISCALTVKVVLRAIATVKAYQNLDKNILT